MASREPIMQSVPTLAVSASCSTFPFCVAFSSVVGFCPRSLSGTFFEMARNYQNIVSYYIIDTTIILCVDNNQCQFYVSH